MHILLHNLDDTKKLATSLAKMVEKGETITLYGDLGAGKTAFARYFIRALTHSDNEVPSPTFTLVQIYDTPHFPLWHFDLYRLETTKDVIELAIEDAFYEAVSLIEWPEIAEKLLPPDRIALTFSILSSESRKVTMKGYGRWEKKLEQIFIDIIHEQDTTMRDILKKQFLDNNGWGEAVIQPIQGDASFRHYERLSIPGQTAILMDAPPGKEDVRPFIAVGNYLGNHKLGAPAIWAADETNGFMLLEDLGNDSYSKVLAAAHGAGTASELLLYEHAIDVLVTLHNLPLPANLPPYDEALLLKEAMLMLEWYFPVLNGEPLSKPLEKEYIDLWKELFIHLEPLPKTVVLRDYHADNLMWLPERQGINKVGLLDFQDAVIGSPAYDILSLLEDARRDVREETVTAMINHYLAAMPHINRKDFLAAYAILGAQRNCKIVGIFSRLSARDGNSAYLKLLPRVWKHISNDVKHPLLRPLKNWLNKVGIHA